MQIPAGYILIKQEEYDKLRKTVLELTEQVSELTKQLAKLSKTSSNSSKPPSSDIVKSKSNKTKGNKGKIGGQSGHPKHTHELFGPDEDRNVHEYDLTRCPECDHAVNIDISQAPRILQQVELVDVPIQREEHKAYAYWCENCQKHHYQDFPEEVVKAGLFLAKITALVAYLKNVCHCSFSTIRKYFRDVLRTRISRSYLSKIIKKVSKSLEAPYNELLNLLPLASKVNVDETGHKENGDRFWTWVFKTDLFVLFKIDKSRGSKVLIDVLGTEFNGILGCDYFSAYRKYMKDFNITIQFCIAHLIRDIKYLTSLTDKKTREYGEALLSSVRAMFKIIHDQSEMSEKDFVAKLTLVKEQLLKTAIECAPSHTNEEGKVERSEVRNMVKRFTDHGKAYFEFITSPGVEPTNNVAEQAVRFVVIDRHVTQGTRSILGRTANERLWTVIATCSLQGKSAYDFILKAVQAYFNDQPSPSLVPVLDTG